MTDHAQTQSRWDMDGAQWEAMRDKLDAIEVTPEAFRQFKETAENIEARIRAFDNAYGEETLRIIVD